MASKATRGSKAAFAMFANKDKEAGGTGKGGCGAVVAAAEHDPNSSAAIKENLLKWCQMKTAGYPGVDIHNFSSSWADGMAFCALIHQYVPHTFDFSRLNPRNRKGNFELAFKVAEIEAGIAPLIDVEDMLLMGNKPDWKCVFCYVQSFYHKMEIEKRGQREAAAPPNENS